MIIDRIKFWEAKNKFPDEAITSWNVDEELRITGIVTTTTASRLNLTVYYGSSFDHLSFSPNLYTNVFSKHNETFEPSTESKSLLISEMKLIGPAFKSDPYASILKSDVSMTPIAIDSGATFGCTPYESDLIKGTIEDVDTSVRNLSGSSQITKRGFGRWIVQDKNGVSATMEPFLYVVII